MKIAFVCENTGSPSFQFYRDSFLEMNQEGSAVSVSLGESLHDFDYQDYDVVLFMGFGFAPEQVRAVNKKALIGVVEPRAAQKNTFEGVDFIITNSMEARDYFSAFHDTFFMYHVYPVVPEKETCPVETDRLVLGYHGNEKHIQAMVPRITDALERLNRDIPIELWAMYNIEKKGVWKKSQSFSFPVKNIQFSYENYARYIANVDIGLVPQLMPVQRRTLGMALMASWNRNHFESARDYLLRFKDTTNIGRHHVFAQYAIPVVSDLTPSATALLGDDVGGSVAYSTAAWEQAIRRLARSKGERQKAGDALYKKWRMTYAHDKQNERLVAFFKTMSQSS